MRHMLATVKVTLLALLAVEVLLGGPMLTRPAQASPTWHLVNYHQNICFDSAATSGYYGIWIKGTWTHALTVGIAHLPAGATSWTSGAPIPPGSSSGVYSLADVGVQLLSTTPVGTYTAWLWASDKTTREAVPVTVTVQPSCGY